MATSANRGGAQKTRKNGWLLGPNNSGFSAEDMPAMSITKRSTTISGRDTTAATVPRTIANQKRTEEEMPPERGEEVEAGSELTGRRTCC